MQDRAVVAWVLMPERGQQGHLVTHLCPENKGVVTCACENKGVVTCAHALKTAPFAYYPDNKLFPHKASGALCQETWK